MLLILLVGETDEAFADIYSSAVSSQNVRPRIPQRAAIVAVAAAGLALAWWLGSRPDLAIGNYEYFLFLLGSVFVPLFGVFVADYFVLGSGARARDAFDGGPSRLPAMRLRALVPWIVGFLVYQWSVPTPLAGWQDAMRTFFHSFLHLPFPLWNSAAGASLPSFGVAFALALLVLPKGRRRAS